MIATIKIDLDGATRTEIESLMDRAMGSYMGKLIETAPAKIDFSQWDKADWDNLVKLAFEACAPAVFTRRIVVIPPTLIEEPPF